MCTRKKLKYKRLPFCIEDYKTFSIGLTYEEIKHISKMANN